MLQFNSTSIAQHNTTQHNTIQYLKNTLLQKLVQEDINKH
jgi:hypothetical protein